MTGGEVNSSRLSPLSPSSTQLWAPEFVFGHNKVLFHLFLLLSDLFLYYYSIYSPLCLETEATFPLEALGRACPCSFLAPGDSWQSLALLGLGTSVQAQPLWSRDFLCPSFPLPGPLPVKKTAAIGSTPYLIQGDLLFP